jgi:hypothetical protein
MVRRKKATVTRAHSLTLPPWKNITLRERIREVTIYAEKQNGHAITLNFSGRFEEYIRVHPEPMRQVQKRMNQELLKMNVQSLPLMLILEVTDEITRPHLHGVFVPGGTDLKRIQQAMRRSVGYLLHQRGSRQFKSELIYDAPIWSKYITKQLRRTKGVLSVKGESELVWISHAITHATRALYESVRLGSVAPANLTSGPTSTAV